MPFACQLIDYDRKRHELMQALAAFRERPSKRSAVSSLDGNTWACMGPFFLQLPTQQVHDMLVKGRPIITPLTAPHPLPTLLCLSGVCVNLRLLGVMVLYSDRAQIEADMDAVRADIKRLLQSLQQYAPSQLNSRLVEFALKESRRAAEGKEMEMDDGQGDEDEIEEGEDDEVLADELG